jgi:hypothetical protein
MAVLFLVFLMGGSGHAEDVAEKAKKPKLAPGCTAWAAKNFVHPPLKCMEKYKRIDEYPVMAWCFHGAGSPGYNKEFVKQAELSGFNVLVDSELMLKPCESFKGMKVFPPAFKYSPAKFDKKIFDRYGDHPLLMGVILDDNCRSLRASMPGGKYLSEKYPHIIPYVSENPTPHAQGKTPMRVMGTQNYEMTRGRAVPGYCGIMNRDRWYANKDDMSFFPIFSAPTPPAIYRFQVNAALAYGAQGVLSFAYCPGDRWPQWKAPDGWLAKAARPVHLYARKIAGRHLWGTRCLIVIHAPGKRIERGQELAMKGRIVEHLDSELMAGFLVPEKDFVGWDDSRAPDYAMVVDKRIPRVKESVFRVAKLRFHHSVTHVDVLRMPKDADSEPIHVIQPGGLTAVKIDAGGGLLLRLNPDLKDIFGDQAEPYTRAARSIGNLRRQIASHVVEQSEFDKASDDVKKSVAQIKGADNVRALEAVNLLTGQVPEIRLEALQPEILRPSGPFRGQLDLELSSRLKGSEICYTLDGSAVTLKSARYSKKLRLKEDVVVKARGVDSTAGKLVGIEVSASYQKANDIPRSLHRINFQPAELEVPKEMLVDSGQMFAVRASGFAHGWVRDRTRSVQQRRKNEDKLLDTGAQMSPTMIWEHLCKNGKYEVTLSVGDAARPSIAGTLTVEGAEFCKDIALERGTFKKITKIVDVKDGRITVQFPKIEQPKKQPRGRRLAPRPSITVNFIEIRAKG